MNPAPRRRRLEAAVAQAIADRQQRQALYRCMKRGRDTRAARLETLPGGAAFRGEVKAAKEAAIADLDALIAEFTRQSEARGAKVFRAATGADAIRYVIELARARGYDNVAKSKSLTTEEIEINDSLIEAGINVVETDLGELIIQLVGDKPFHLVFPSVHKMQAEVAEIFAKATGEPVENNIPAIMRVVRAYLRPIFLNTGIGMTGANIGIAENGAIVIETNEGNGRLVSSIGKCHVCIMGVEKIVPTIEDALLMVLAHPVSAAGQLPTTYVSWLAGRSPLGEDGPERESHIILLDNGRGAMREDPAMREALHCIRCGACMNICPTYGVAGGHVFGHIYPGPIGIPWTASVHGLETAGDFAELCVSCGLCKEICPADIDMPLMIAEVKQRDAVQHPIPRVNRMLMAAERAARIGSACAPVANRALRNPAFRWLLEKTAGIDRRRTLPPFAARPFGTAFRAQRGTPAPNPGARQAVIFHDVYANYNAPELAWAAAARLEALGYEVVVPEQEACGYPYIAYGDLDKAREAAARNIAAIAPYARAGAVIAATEPTAAYCLKLAYPKLLPHREDARAIAARTRDFFRILLDEEPAPAPGARPLEGKRFGFHCPCHQRPLEAGAAAEWLERQGAAVERIDTGSCCGMAGTYGLKAGTLGFDLAQAVGEPLFDAVREAGVAEMVTESSVCAIHLRDGAGCPVHHPLLLLGAGAPKS